MTDEDRDETPTGTDSDLEVVPASEEAYPSLELDQLTESDRSERGGWRYLDDE